MKRSALRVYGYIRVSGIGQVDKDGPTRQRKAIEDFCAAHGMELLGCFSEPGVSGTLDSMDRPEFVSMMTTIEQAREKFEEQIDGIVVEQMDRIARDLLVSELFVGECRKRNLKLFASDQGAPNDMATSAADPTRVLIRQILGALAQWDKTNTVRKLKAARDRIKQTGVQCEGKKPYGHYPGEKPMVVSMRMLRESGLSYEAVTEQINDLGYRNRRGNLFDKTTIRVILRNEDRRADAATSQR